MSGEMASQRERYEKYASTIKTLYIVVGLWPGPGFPKFGNYLVAFYSSCVTIVVLAGINYIVHNLTNVSDVTESMCSCISTSTAIVKVTMYTWNRNDIKKMHESLEKTFRRDFSKSEHQSVLLSPLNYFYQSTMMMTKTFIMLSVAVSLSPLISMILQFVRGVNPIKYHLVLLLTYPWNPKSNGAIYLVHYFIESLGAISTGIVSLTVDVGFGFYIFQIATQFRVLAYRLRILESGSDYRHLIRECVLRRRILSECCNSLERTYGPVVLWMMITNALSLCANIYKLSKMSTEGLATSLLFIAMKFCQSLFYAWFGTFLTSETESFRDAVYSSRWPGSGEIPFMTSILIMLMWKPMVLTACHFSTISLDMFVAILNTAISYFFLLQKIEEGK